MKLLFVLCLVLSFAAHGQQMAVPDTATAPLPYRYHMGLGLKIGLGFMAAGAVSFGIGSHMLNTYHPAPHSGDSGPGMIPAFFGVLGFGFGTVVAITGGVVDICQYQRHKRAHTVSLVSPAPNEVGIAWHF